MNKTSSVLLGAVASCALVLSACGSGEGGSGDAGSGPRVVASFYPFAYVVEQVGGGSVEVENLTSPGTEPHDLELKPRQVADVQDADLVVYETDFQAAVDEAVEQADLPGEKRLDVADVVTLVKTEDEEGHDHAAEGEDGHDHEAEEDHDHDHEGEGEEGHDHDHGHDHGGVDPHVWLDPANMVKITASVADRLSELDPDGEAEYRANAEAFTAELTELDQAFETGLARCTSRDVVTSHEAFGYLARAYDLRQIPIAGIEPGTEPSASQLAEITDLVRSDGITTVFTEELVSPAIARTVAEETGAQTATLSPIEGLTDETADETYLTLMRQNLAAIQKANRCS